MLYMNVRIIHSTCYMATPLLLYRVALGHRPLTLAELLVAPAQCIQLKWMIVTVVDAALYKNNGAAP